MKIAEMMNRTATKALAEHKATALANLDALRKAIEAYDPLVPHWGHVGSMEEVARQIAAALEVARG